MNSRKRIRAIIDHQPTDQVGVSFNPPNKTDIMPMIAYILKRPNGVDKKYMSWGNHKELLDQVPNFKGEVKYDKFGNILGRLNGLTKGECVKGVLVDWDDLDNFELPELDKRLYNPLYKLINKCSPKFVTIHSGFSVFSVLRDTRLMENALMDILLEEENVEKFLQKILAKNLELIECVKNAGIDALIFADDWGTQDRTFISPDAFRRLFKPIYKAVAERLHSYNMKLIVHSCGYNYAFMEDFIDAGIDVLQFDQLGAYGYERMADEFAHRVTFWSPLDIQMTLPTGNQDLIEREAKRMVDAFKGKGGLILKDYPTYGDIGVKQEWASWARKIFMSNLKN